MDKIRVNNYSIENSKIHDNTTIASISDIHSDVSLLYQVYELLKSLKIDLICIPGDTIDSTNNVYNKETLELLKRISDLAKLYISIGNHDMFKISKTTKEIVDYNYEFFKELEKEINCIVLRKEFESIRHSDDITISAINLPLDYYYQSEDEVMFNSLIEKYKGSLDKEQYNVLLSHSPNRIIKNNEIITDGLISETDLILCGHNHGGITPTFIQNISKNHIGLFGPYSRIMVKNSYGSYSNEDTNLIINNGVTKVSKSASIGFASNIVNRIFIPDIDIINLRNGEGNTLVKEKSKIYRK